MILKMGRTLVECLIRMKKIKTILGIIFCVIIIPSKGQVPTVGISIQGDFVGDGKKDVAFVVRTKEQVGNPADGGSQQNIWSISHQVK